MSFRFSSLKSGLEFLVIEPIIDSVSYECIMSVFKDLGQRDRLD